MSNNLKISIIQFDVFWNNVSKNLSFLDSVLDKANDSDLIIFPELFDTGFVTDISIFNQKENKQTFDWMQEKAKEYSSAIVGSTYCNVENAYKNRLVFAKPDGISEYYDKKHLFTIAKEDNFVRHGKQRRVVEYKNWKINLQICYDLRFPVWSRNTSNYDMMIYVANWPNSRIEQWKALLIARAIENQCYVVGVNRIGIDGNKFDYPGKSLIVDYKGRVVYEAPENELDVHSLELDYNKLQAARETFPVLKDADNFRIED